MEETTSSGTAFDGNWTTSGTIPQLNFTNTTNSCSDILSLTVNTSWTFLDYYIWPKGVSDYSFEQKYKPKWHILQGYKNQIKTMWD